MKTFTQTQITTQFDDNRMLAVLLGEFDCNLAIIEERLNISATVHGNLITLEGSKEQCEMGEEVLEHLYGRIIKGDDITPGDIEGAIRHAQHTDGLAGDTDPDSRETPPTFVLGEEADGDQHQGKSGNLKSGKKAGKKASKSEQGKMDQTRKDNGQARIKTRKKHITARTPRQSRYIRAMERSDLVFGIGPAGTGKTYLAVAAAAAALERGAVERIILSRPAVEAGERLGFLPGDMRDKVDPYLRPLYDALYDCLPAERVEKEIENGIIEIAPLAFMRGRTLASSFVILDEAQNCTSMQMKMFLTRLGENSKMVITGDPSQIDLPQGQISGLREAVLLLRDVDEIETIMFENEDVVRRALVAKIVAAYDEKSDAV